MINLAYRPSNYLRHPWELVSEVYWGVKQGLRKIWEWLPIVWYDRDWDQSFLLEVMAHKLERMAELHRLHGHLMNSGKTARQCAVAGQLCRRMLRDSYIMTYEVDDEDWAPELGPWQHRRSGVSFSKKRKFYDEYMAAQDLELLTKMMRRHMRKWWD